MEVPRRRSHPHGATTNAPFIFPCPNLGAVLMTGYLGGAVAAHLRIADTGAPPFRWSSGSSPGAGCTCGRVVSASSFPSAAVSPDPRRPGRGRGRPVEAGRRASGSSQAATRANGSRRAPRPRGDRPREFRSSTSPGATREVRAVGSRAGRWRRRRSKALRSPGLPRRAIRPRGRPGPGLQPPRPRALRWPACANAGAFCFSRACYFAAPFAFLGSSAGLTYLNSTGPCP